MDDVRQRPARLAVGVVGAGRVGAVLGAALHAAGHRVVAASGLDDTSVARARALLPDTLLTSPEDVVAAAELVLVTVPAGVLPELVGGLARRGCWQAGQIVVHTNARHGTAVLRPATAAHTLPVALHPAMRFTGTRLDLERLPEACMAVTAPSELRPIGEALAIEMGLEPMWVEEQHRGRYAAAIAHVSGHVGLVVEQSRALLAIAGMPAGSRLLAVLAVTALDAALRSQDRDAGGEAVLDARLLQERLAALDEVSPDARAVHLALARAETTLAVAGGMLATHELDAVLDVLQDRPQAR